MSNDRLASAIAARALTPRELADQLLVDAKTVERWLRGRVPQPRNRTSLARLLGQPESYLWPALKARPAAMSNDTPGLLHVYPHRSDVPRPLWQALLNDVEEGLDVLAYAAQFLAEENPQLVPILHAKADTIKVRLALGNPACDKVAERGREEKLYEAMAARIRTTLRHLQPLADCPGIEVRFHETTLYNSIFRFDKQMLVNTHRYGGPAYLSPMLHLRHTQKGDMFDLYAQSFEAVWSTSVPLDPDVWNSP